MSEQPTHLELPDAVTPPPPPAAPTGPVPERQPMVAGTVVLDEATRRTLEEWGWKEGDPLPGNLATLYDKAFKTIEQDIATATPNVPDDFKLVTGEPIPMEMLPPEQQTEIRAALERAKTLQAEINKVAEQDAAWQIPGANPAVNEAISKNIATMVEQKKDEPFKLVDDVDEALATATATTPPPQPVAPSAPAGLSPEDAAVFSETPPPVPKDCPKCGHNPMLPFDVEVTGDDKMQFTAGILSAGNARFLKTYVAYKGKFKATFRTLTTMEMQEITRQVSRDMRAPGNDINTDMDMFSKVMEYRCAASVHALSGGSIAYVAPETMQTNPPIEEPLKMLLTQVNQHVLTAEPLKRVVARKFNEFQRLVEKLEVMVDDPDF